MKITKIKKGTRVLNKVNGKTYEVTELNKDKDVLTGVAIAINPETDAPYASADEEYNEVVITEANDICFRTIFIPEDTVIPAGYTAKDGVLLRADGKPATEQGQIYVEHVIYALPGYLVLAVRPREEKEGYIDLFIYRPEKDKFKKLLRTSIPNPVVFLVPDDESIVLGYNATHQVDVLDENGTPTGEKKEIFDGAAIMLVRDGFLDLHDGYLDYEKLPLPMDFKCVKEILGANQRWLLGTNKAVDSDGAIVEGEWHYVEIKTAVEEGFDVTSLSPQPGASVVSAATVNLTKGGIVLKGTDFIQYNDLRIESPLVQQIAGSYLVDVTFEESSVIMTFADEKYNTSRIKRQSTRDRGYIVSLV